MATVLDAIKALAARDTDHARIQNGIGFNGRDSEFGNSLATRSFLTEKQENAARKMLAKYAKQLASYGIDINALESSQRMPVYSTEIKNPEIKRVNDRKTSIHNDSVVFNFPYDPTIKDNLKDHFNGAYFFGQTKSWIVPIYRNGLENIILWAKRHNFDVTALEAKLLRVRSEQDAQAQANNARFNDLISKIDLENVGNGIALRSYQKDGVKTILQRERIIVADDMGLGKTIQALVAAKAYQGTHSIFVVAPISLHGNWRREAKKVNAHIELYSWAKIPESPEKPYIVIADEAHYAQNSKAARTKKLLDLCENATAVILLSGTPIKNGRPVNLFPLLVATKHELAKDKKAYEKRYCNAHATRFTAWDTTGSAFLEELNEKTADVIMRRTKKQVLTDLPEKTRILRPVDLCADAEKAYSATYNELRKRYQERIADGTISQDGAVLVLLNHLRHAGSIAKVSAAVEMAEELLEQGQSVVLFFEFSDSAKEAATRLQSHGVSLLTGETPGKERDKIVQEFQNGINKVFCGTIKAGGVGLTLTAASTVLLVDRPWTPGDAVQAEDRIHRIGQENACTAFWLQCGEIDEKIDGILTAKAEKIGVVLGDDSIQIEYANLAADIF